jgi:uncharacterized protein (DUF433 family)
MLFWEEKGDADTGKCVLEMGPVGCPGRGYADASAPRDPRQAGPTIGLHMETPSTSYRYIVRSPDVRGGHARVEGTRIGVHDVIGLIVNGASVDEVCRSFPDLKRSHVYECLAYYEDHRAEIDDLVAVQMHDPNA